MKPVLLSRTLCACSLRPNLAIGYRLSWPRRLPRRLRKNERFDLPLAGVFEDPDVGDVLTLTTHALPRGLTLSTEEPTPRLHGVIENETARRHSHDQFNRFGRHGRRL